MLGKRYDELGQFIASDFDALDAFSEHEIPEVPDLDQIVEEQLYEES